LENSHKKSGNAADGSAANRGEDEISQQGGKTIRIKVGDCGEGGGGVDNWQTDKQEKRSYHTEKKKILFF
jgi:hypothetical protein